MCKQRQILETWIRLWKGVTILSDRSMRCCSLCCGLLVYGLRTCGIQFTDSITQIRVGISNINVDMLHSLNYCVWTPLLANESERETWTFHSSTTSLLYTIYRDTGSILEKKFVCLICLRQDFAHFSDFRCFAELALREQLMSSSSTTIWTFWCYPLICPAIFPMLRQQPYFHLLLFHEIP